MRCWEAVLTCPGVTALKGLLIAITWRQSPCSLTTHRAMPHNTVVTCSVVYTTYLRWGHVYPLQ